MHQRSEAEIMNNWAGDINTPLVSICTITYNHEQFIENALDSFLTQETNFPFEIVIDDDCSTDENANIIQSYIDKYPNIINANLRSTNVGIAINFSGNLKRSRGKYLALCEGDDYWTDEHKLQIQYDILEGNEEIDMCFHKAIRLDMRNQEKLNMGTYLSHNGIIPIEDILLKSKGQIPTASIILRKNAVNDFMSFYASRLQYIASDIFVQFFGSKRGGAYYINQTMSVYRHYTQGSWSSMQQNDDYKKKIVNSNSRIKAYEELDTFEDNHFTLAFNAANKKRAIVIIKDPDIPWFAKISFILKYRKYFLINEKIVYIGSAIIPISSYIPEDIYQYLKKLFKMPSYKEK